MPRAVGVTFKPVEHLVLHVRRNPRTGIGHGEDHAVLGPLRGQADDGILGRESDGIGQKVIQHLHYPALVGHEASDVGIDIDLELDAIGREPVLDAFRGGLNGLADIDRTQIERHRSGIDSREIEDVVDDRKQRVRRGGDVTEILGLLRRQWTGNWVAQEMRKADDGGQRRAQFIRDVVHEIDLHLVGGLKRLVALAKRALDVLGVGDVLEGQHGGAVRQRHGHAVQHAAVPAFQLQRYFDPVLDRRDGFADRAPRLGVVEQRLAPAFHRFDMRLLAQCLRRQLPHPGEGRIKQLRSAVAAEHRNRFAEIVQRFTLHPDQPIEPAGKIEAFSNIVEQIGDAAFRIRRGHHADGAPAGEIPGVLDRLDRAIRLMQLGLPGAEVRLLRKFAPCTQPIEHARVVWITVEKHAVEVPKPPIGVVIERQPPLSVKHGDPGR